MHGPGLRGGARDRPHRRRPARRLDPGAAMARRGPGPARRRRALAGAVAAALALARPGAVAHGAGADRCSAGRRTCWSTAPWTWRRSAAPMARSCCSSGSRDRLVREAGCAASASPTPVPRAEPGAGQPSAASPATRRAAWSTVGASVSLAHGSRPRSRIAAASTGHRPGRARRSARGGEHDRAAGAAASPGGIAITPAWRPAGGADRRGQSRRLALDANFDQR